MMVVLWPNPFCIVMQSPQQLGSNSATRIDIMMISLNPALATEKKPSYTWGITEL